MNLKGKLFEDIAYSYLLDLDFEILDRNFSSKFGEIDIIAKKNDTLHIIEVKGGEGEPIYNITKSKLNKIIKTTYIYLNKKSLNLNYQIDALIVGTKKIEFIQNITL